MKRQAASAPPDTPCPRLSRIAACAVTAGLVTVLGAGCARPVEAAAPTGAGDAACTRAAAAWPARVADADRRDTNADSPAVAAWGDPPIVARCGVASPGPTTDECVAVDDVDWIVHRVPDGAVLTTYGRAPALEVLVPAHYAPEPLVLGSFGAAARALPGTGHHCS